MRRRISALILTLTLSVCVAGLAVVTTQASDSSFPQATAIDVVISEIAWMGTTTSPNDEWVELHNNTLTTVDLSGWTLSAADGTPSISLAGSIPPEACFLLERTDDASVPGVPADQVYTGDLGNEGEDLVLRDASSNIIDRVDCSSGWYAGHAEARVPMVRVHLTATGSISTSWTYNPRCGTATNSDGVSHTCTLTTTYVGHAFDYAVAFNERATTAAYTTTEQTSLERSLLNLIEGASTSIDVAPYSLDCQSMDHALIDAPGRGFTMLFCG